MVASDRGYAPSCIPTSENSTSMHSAEYRSKSASEEQEVSHPKDNRKADRSHEHNQDLSRYGRPPDTSYPPAELPCWHLGPVQQAGHGTKLSGDHADPNEEGQHAWTGEYPERQAAECEDQAT